MVSGTDITLVIAESQRGKDRRNRIFDDCSDGFTVRSPAVCGYYFAQIVGGQTVRFKHDSARPSTELIDQFLEEFHQKSVPTTSTTISSKLFGLMHDTVHQPVLAPVVCGGSRLLSDDVEGPGRLLVDLDDQTMVCRRQSAAVIEQVFDAMDFTQQQRDPRAGIPTSPNFSSVISVQYSYCFQGI